jgi:hypothetical protein
MGTTADLPGPHADARQGEHTGEIRGPKVAFTAAVLPLSSQQLQLLCQFLMGSSPSQLLIRVEIRQRRLSSAPYEEVTIALPTAPLPWKLSE